MKLFANKHIKRLYLIAYISLFITLIINLFLGSQIQTYYGQISLAQQGLVKTNSLLYSIKNTESIFKDIVVLDDNDDKLEKQFHRAKNDVYDSFEEIKDHAAHNRENLESLAKIKSLIDRNIQIMNIGLQQYKSSHSGNEVSDHMSEATELIRKIDKEIAVMREREESKANIQVEKSLAAFKLSTPSTLLTLLVISLLSVFSLVMRNEKKDLADDPKHANKSRNENENQANNDEQIRTIIHEIKNPLNNIIMACSVLEGGSSNAAVIKEMIQKNSDKIDQLVNELLVPPQEKLSLKMEKVLVKDLVEDALSQVEHKVDYLNIRLLKHYSDDRCAVYADAQKLKIVVLNLIVNAIEAMNKDVKILSVATKIQGSYCRIEISDNGVGMHQETLKKIFEPHFTSKKKGSGLGLTNSKNLILKLGGNIEVDSKPGKGSCFTLTLRSTPNAKINLAHEE